MGRLRVSATDIDAFRRFRATEDASLEDLIAGLRRESQPTDRMRAGTALHHALEHALHGTYDSLEALGFRFDVVPDVALDLPDIRELRAFRDMMVNDVPITLTGMVDGMHGRTIIDHKLTVRVDLDRFLNSYQWRIYLDLFGADRFCWIVYEADEDRDDPQHYTIKAVHRLEATRYPGMSDDVERELRAFVDMAKSHLLQQEAA